ncbi:hypothetical protein MFIFM68171_11025 [Madurella fahalii]|uniref:Uncharacterized protein n=1 Tax=Madurella fahalii TaxID=1157608 RepID=A0ABQ0GSV3_9PEZI
MAPRPQGGQRPADILPHILNEIVVATGKAFKAAKQDGTASLAEVAAAMEARVPASIERFNWTLDDLESDILRAKAVFTRDLNLRRANRKPPQIEQQPVAPPAPMTVDLTSPRMVAKEIPTGQSAPSRPGNPADKPVAPFPNMGFDVTSPEVAAVPSPKMTPKLKEAKNLARPAMAATATATAAPATTTTAAGRPASAPPKKETKIPPPQIPKPGTGAASVNQSPIPTQAQIKASSVPAPNFPPPAAAPNNTPAAVGGHENLFTDMTFSLVPPGEAQPQGQKEAPAPAPAPQAQRKQSQPQPPVIDLTNIGSGSGAGDAGGEAPASVTNPNSGRAGEDTSITDIDAEINGLFDLGPGGIDDVDLSYGLDGDHGDNSNFNDMYFGGGDSSAAAEFDDTYFNLNG